MSLVHNERTKLLATAMNNTAVATIVTAIVAPIVGSLYGAPSTAANKWWPLIALAWLSVGVGIHVLAQIALGRLKE
jgi:Na+/melibiose symporter-like transporter